LIKIKTGFYFCHDVLHFVILDLSISGSAFYGVFCLKSLK